MVALLGLAGTAACAHAQAAAPGAAQPYPERYAAQCAACHGAVGISTLAGTPSLAGQPSFYAITQLFLFRDGRRDSPVMTAIAKGMTDADLRAYSDAIGQLPAAPGLPTSAPDASRQARDAALAQRLHCLGCHGDAAEGARQVPRLAGLREDYLQHALRGFRAGSRVGYTPAMSEALAGVTPAEIDDLAYHLAHFMAPGSAKP